MFSKIITICMVCTCVSVLSAADIHDAVQNGDLATVMRLLDEDPSRIESVDDDGMTPLNRAAFAGKTDIAAELLQRGADIHAGDVDNSQPLHCAAISGDTAIAAMLLARGTDVNVQDNNGTTPLHFASSYQQHGMAAYLLTHGADVNAHTSQGLFPIIYAAHFNNLYLAALLVEHGADVNGRTNDGSTPLHTAASRGALEVFDFLVTQGADIHAVNEEGISVLHTALGPESYAIAKKLLEAGIDANVRTAHSLTPLHMVPWQGTIPTAELLIEHGADINARDNNGWTPLINAAHRSAAFTQLFLSHGADVNPDMPIDTVDGTCRASGITPLYGAVRSDSLNTVMLLVQHGADINIPDDNGVTPLHFAIGNCSNDIARYLISQGATISREDKFSRTELHTASIKGMRDIAGMLIKAGASIEAQDTFHRTPLDYALNHGFADVAELLKDNGAELNEVAGLVKTVPLVSRPLDEKEAVVWYLEHSGWAIITKNHFLVFDYFMHDNRTYPPGASLASGHIVPAELTDQKVTVFVSHHHADHYDPAILDWRDTLPDVTYLFGFRPRDIDVSAYRFLGPRTEHTINDMNISTIKATDAGVGFLIEVDGLVIFHAGDHANEYEDLSGEYPAEIDYLAAKDLDIDFAFLGITGCSLGDPVSVKKGVYYAIETLNPRIIFPQHGGTATYRYREFADEAAAEGYSTRIVCAADNGDRFFYTHDSISKH